MECPDVFKQVEFWRCSRAEFNLSAVHSTATNTTYFVEIQGDQLLASPVLVTSLDTSSAKASGFSISTAFTTSRDGMLHGFVGWFAAHLSPGVILTNSPLATKAMQRSQLFFPIQQPFALAKNDCVEFKLRSLPQESVITWSVTVPGKGSSKHSTWNGMLLSEEDLLRSRPSFIPNLTSWGKARLSVLGLCDGQRTSAEISQQVFSNYPQLFHSFSEASAFVAEVILRYSK